MSGRTRFKHEEQDIQAGEHRLRVARLRLPGSEAGLPTLVFLHEGLGSIPQWRDYPQALAGALGLPALIYDRYGYGRSQARTGPQDPLYLELEAHDRLPRLLEACGIRHPFLVGHSDGASIALLFAARYPEIPVGVISEAAHVVVEPMSVDGIRKALKAFETTSFRDRLAKYHGDKVDAVFHGWADTWMNPRHLGWSMVHRLPSITAPVLAIQGEDDEYGTPCQVEAIVRGVAGPAQALMLPGCGHVPHFQAREAVLEAMAEFVRDTLRSSPLMEP